MSGRGMAGWWSAVGWNCTNSTSATGTPARSAMAIPSPVASVGLVVTEYICPAPPHARTTWEASTRRRSPAGSSASDARAAAGVDDEVEGEPVLEDGSGTVAHSRDEGTLHLGAGGRAARVQDSSRRVATFPCPRQPAAGDPVKHGAEGDELVDPLGAFVDEHTNRGLVAQAGSGAQRVGQVEVGRVLVARQHGGDAALRPTRGRLLELTLGENADTGAARAGRGEPRQKARHAAPDDEDVETPRAALTPLGASRPPAASRPRCHSCTARLSIRRTPSHDRLR